MYWVFSIEDSTGETIYIGCCTRRDYRSDGSIWSREKFERYIISDRLKVSLSEASKYTFKINLETVSRAEARQLRKELIVFANDSELLLHGAVGRGRHQYIDTELLLHPKRRKVKRPYCILCVDTMEIFKSTREAGIKYNVRGNSIQYALDNKDRTSAGYRWRRIE